MKIITEEMRFRKRLCEFALKNGVTKAARRYHTNRQFIYRQLEKYDGTLRSLALKSRKPHSHPNAHTTEELEFETFDRFTNNSSMDYTREARKCDSESITLKLGFEF